MNFTDPFGLCTPKPVCEWPTNFVIREIWRPYLNNPSRASEAQGLSSSLYHMMDGELGNRRWLSPDGKHEAIIGPDGDYVEGINGPTYNYGGATGLDHVVLDVIPFMIVGNHHPDGPNFLDRVVGPVGAAVDALATRLNNMGCETSSSEEGGEEPYVGDRKTRSSKLGAGGLSAHVAWLWQVYCSLSRVHGCGS